MKEKLKAFIDYTLIEFLRLAEISVLPILVTSVDLATGAFVLNYLVLKALLFVSFIKAVDKGLHKSGIAEKGLVRF